jgi:hypothetical protein
MTQTVMTVGGYKLQAAASAIAENMSTRNYMDNPVFMFTFIYVVFL